MPNSIPRRLLLRLGTTCNNGCRHCTVADLRRYSDRPLETLVAALAAGREEGCSEVVLLRGEPTIREDFFDLCRAARDQGYQRIQAQTNGRMFALDGFLERSREAGLTHAETSLYGATETLHDAIASAPGAFQQSSMGLERLAHAEMHVQVNVPILEENVMRLPDIVEHAANRGARCIQFNFQRPLPENPISSLRLKACEAPLAEALARGALRGVVVKTEAIPLCLLPAGTNSASDAWDENAPPFLLIDDLHRRTRDIPALRAAYRGEPEPCTRCRLRGTCPTTWSHYFECHGSDELIPV